MDYNEIFLKLNKNKAYCNKCLKENVISEMNIDINDKNYFTFPNCKHINCRPFYKVLWNEEKQKWICSQGLKIKAVSTDELSKKSKAPENCSICGIYNKLRDQNGRGIDIGYGDGEWITNHDIIDNNSGKIIVCEGQKCGCNCSQKFYQKHNSSDEMIKQAKNMVNKWNSSDEFKEFIIKHNQSEEMKKISSQNLINNTLPGYCVNPECHKWSESRSSSGLCKDCIAKIRKPKFCKNVII